MVFFKTTKVANVSNGGAASQKKVFDSGSLERGVKTGQVSNVSNGLGTSKGIIGKGGCSLAGLAGWKQWLGRSNNKTRPRCRLCPKHCFGGTRC